DSAATMRLVGHRGNRPLRRDRVARLDGPEEAARVLQVRDTGAAEEAAGDRSHQRTGEIAVKDARAVAGFRSELLVDVHRMEIPEQARGQDEVRLGERHAVGKSLADVDLVIGLAGEHGQGGVRARSVERHVGVADDLGPLRYFRLYEARELLR